MQRYFILAISAFFLLLFSSSVVFAQQAADTPTPTLPQLQIDQNNLNQLIPTVDPQNQNNLLQGSCGFAGGPANKCCANSNTSTSNFLGKVKGAPDIDSSQVFNPLSIIQPCFTGAATTDSANNCTCVLDETPVAQPGLKDLCYRFASNKEQTACLQCADTGALFTSIGCIPVSLNNFINSYVIPKAVAAAGLIAFFCIIASAFSIQRSQGDKTAIQKARESLTSCIMGLLVVIFAILIIRIIGVNILKIPGFG